MPRVALGRWPYPEDGVTPCVECGKNVKLYWNGGELDVNECCGVQYVGEHVTTVFTATKIVEDP